MRVDVSVRKCITIRASLLRVYVYKTEGRIRETVR